MLSVAVIMTASARTPPSGPTGSTADGRVECEHAARCGGCLLIDSPYPAQLEAKADRVRKAFAPFAMLEGAAVTSVEPADPITRYRTRAKLVVGPEGELGLYARGAEHEVVDIPGCQVLAPSLSAVARAIRKRIAADAQKGGPLAPAVPRSTGALTAVDLREVRDGEGPAVVLVTWVFDRERAPDRRTLEQAATAFIRAMPSVAGIAANFRKEGAPQILGSETTLLAGVGTVPDRVGASRHLATFGSFVQAHRGQAAKIHAVIAEVVGRAGAHPRVLDLYGGSGAIALGLAALGARVHLVESFAPAVAQAEAEARHQKLDLHAQCADAGRSVVALADAHETFDVVVLNPPRRGLHPAVREGVARLAPQRIVYVSCDPATLARDLDRFARLGFAASAVRPFDMIPLTGEVEVVAVLERGPVAPPRVVYEDDDVVVVDKGAHEPVLPDPRASVTSLTDRVRAIAGCEQARAVHALDADASGVVVFARSAEGVDAWQRALKAPTTKAEFIAGARGILRGKGSITRMVRTGRRSRPARLRYVRSAVFSSHSLARVMPDEAGGEAIRGHLASVGHPVLGDDRSGDPATNRHFAEKAGLDRAFLHRARIEVDHPRLGQRVVLEAPLAGDLQAVVDHYGVASRRSD